MALVDDLFGQFGHPLMRARKGRKGKRHWRDFRLLRRDTRYCRVMYHLEDHWIKTLEGIDWEDRLDFWTYVRRFGNLPEGAHVVYDIQANDNAIQFDSEESLSIFILQWSQ